MSQTIRPAATDDIPRLVELLLMDAAERHAKDAVLWKIYLDTHLQRQGLGGRLLADVVAHLWPGTQRLFTEYVTGNDKAAAFYARHGFEFDHVESDNRPDVDVTYTWCVRSASEPIHLS